MKILTYFGLFISVCFILSPFTVLGEPQGPQGPPNGLNVNVVNPLPVPVTGDVNATVVNMPEVEVTNTLDVNVANVPEVIVANNHKEPIILFEQPRAYPGGATPVLLREAGAGTSDPFVVPDNTQLVIEYVSMATFTHRVLLPGEDYQGYISDNMLNRFLVGTVRGENDVHEFGPDSGQMVKLRFKPGSNVKFGIFGNVDTLVNVTVSGYLETIE